MRLNIEAYPDPVPPLVDIVAQNAGQSAEEMERYVTIPLEIQMAGIPHVSAIRTISLFGLSDVKLQFTYDVTYEEAKQMAIYQLAQLSSLPSGVKPQISPWSPIGEIFRYRVVGPKGYSVTDLRTIEDWQFERRFKAVPGVVDVNGWGGKSKTYDVSVDLKRLNDAGLTLAQVIQALNNNNLNVGGQTLNFGQHAAVIRGVALIQSMDAIRNTIVSASGGAATFVRDVADVEESFAPRLGIAGQDDDDDIVQGIVLMRRGEKTTPTIRRVEAEMDKINASGILPPGVHLERIYDRSELIGLTTEKVLTNLTFGIILIFAVQWLFLGSLRSAIVVSATIPFALFFAVMLLVLFGKSANLLSVGAIDFGLIVDATVILVENVFRRLAAAGAARPSGNPLAGHVRARRPLRQARRHRRRDRRGRSRRAVLRADHHRRLRAALHAPASKVTYSDRWRRLTRSRSPERSSRLSRFRRRSRLCCCPNACGRPRLSLFTPYAASMARRFASRSPTVS